VVLLETQLQFLLLTHSPDVDSKKYPAASLGTMTHLLVLN